MKHPHTKYWPRGLMVVKHAHVKSPKSLRGILGGLGFSEYADKIPWLILVEVSYGPKCWTDRNWHQDL